MERLGRFPLEDPSDIQSLRRKSEQAPDDPTARIDFGIALGQSGCSYEAAFVLRPLRAQWKSSDVAKTARAALEAQSWWNKNWRDFAQLRQAGEKDAALSLLADRAVLFWDLPPLLLHLAHFATDDGKLQLAEHIYRRVSYLSRRGLPKMNMTAFTFAAQAGLVEVLLAGGKAHEALAHHCEITPNPGNAMAHEIQHLTLLVATDALDHAMGQAASMIVTARKHRSGYSRDIRLDFVERAPELAPLRERADWAAMVSDPAKYLRST